MLASRPAHSILVDRMNDSRKLLKQTIQEVLLKIQELESAVQSTEGVPDLFSESTDDLVKGLQKLHEQSSKLDYRLPAELLTYLDKGGNPDVYTSEVFARANRANQYSKGKVEALSGFRDTLRREAASKYPQEAAAYKDLQEQKTAEPSNAV